MKKPRRSFISTKLAHSQNSKSKWRALETNMPDPNCNHQSHRHMRPMLESFLELRSAFQSLQWRLENADPTEQEVKLYVFMGHSPLPMIAKSILQCLFLLDSIEFLKRRLLLIERVMSHNFHVMLNISLGVLTVHPAAHRGEKTFFNRSAYAGTKLLIRNSFRMFFNVPLAALAGYSWIPEVHGIVDHIMGPAVGTVVGVVLALYSVALSVLSLLSIIPSFAWETLRLAGYSMFQRRRIAKNQPSIMYRWAHGIRKEAALWGITTDPDDPFWTPKATREMMRERHIPNLR